MDDIEFPEDWNEIKLSDQKAVVTSSGGTPSRAVAENFDGNILWVKSGELKDNWIFDTEEKITQLGLANSSAKLFPPETLLIAMYGATVGRTAILKTIATTNQAVCAVIPQNNILDSQFLQYNFILIRPKLLRARSGGAQPNISQQVINSLKISVPPLPEQRTIARALRTVQEAKEARQRELGLERERKAALMQHLFTHGTRGEARKQTEIGEMPESWQVVKLGQKEFCQIRTSFPSFNLIPILDSQNEQDEIVLALKVSDMNAYGNNKHLITSQLFFHSSAKDTKSKFLEPNSVVFPKRGAAISTNKKRLTKYFSILDPNLIAIEPTASINSDYLFAWFEKFDLRTIQDNNPIPQLNKNDVERIKFSLPELGEQLEIAQIHGACDNKIATLQTEIERLDELFKAMLEELMTGKLSALNLIENE